jgi:protein-glutamine gamma-glutamyltransferase
MTRLESVLKQLVIVSLSLSAMLLGMSQGTAQPLLIASGAALLAWLVVDMLEWFSLPQWLANVLALIVTIFTVAVFFFTGDPTTQLIGVGNLLIYLQSILLFQKKSSRVYWQILVLGLLQVVVAAVFNLGFEGGVLFVIYLMFAGVTMLVLHSCQQHEQVMGRGLVAVRTPGSGLRESGISAWARKDSALSGNSLYDMIRHYLLMGCGTLVFGIALFYFVPRQNSSWGGIREAEMSPAGLLQQVSLAHADVIPMSTQLVMTIKFRWNADEECVFPEEVPYIRGVALANVEIEDGVTTWKPATSQIGINDYRTLVSQVNGDQRRLLQEIVLEPTADPLIYSVFPCSGLAVDTEDRIEFCWPVGCITRERTGNKIAVAHYRYSIAIPVHNDMQFYKAWRYFPRNVKTSEKSSLLTKESDEGTWSWLTAMDRSRYPTLVRAASEVRDRTGDNSYAICQAMVQRLSPRNGFSYTTDFREISRNRALDPVEDFFANFKSGHCAYYASSLALMLRSVGIPARVVTGYRGGSRNEFGDHYDVETRHSHAWVEAYIPPDDCPQEWKDIDASGQFGAWMQLDATPPLDGDEATGADAFNFVRSLYRDYVTGLQEGTGANSVTLNGVRLSGMFRVLDLAWWQDISFRFRANSLREGTWENQVRRIGPWVAVFLFMLILGLNRKRLLMWFSKGNSAIKDARRTGIRQRAARWFGNAMASVAPGLARWFGAHAGEEKEIAFYRTFARLLENRGLSRTTGQTHMEFVDSLVPNESAVNRGIPPEVQEISRRITGLYYQVRYGGIPANAVEKEEIENSLARLQSLLAGGQK